MDLTETSACACTLPADESTSRYHQRARQAAQYILRQRSSCDSLSPWEMVLHMLAALLLLLLPLFLRT